MYGPLLLSLLRSNETLLPSVLNQGGGISTQRQTLLSGWWYLRLWGNILKCKYEASQVINEMETNEEKAGTQRVFRTRIGMCRENLLCGYHLRPENSMGSSCMITQAQDIQGSLKSM